MSTSEPDTVEAASAEVERRGRRFIFGSFLLCPCHLPFTLGILAAAFGGTALGAFLRHNMLLAGVVITAGWLAGTARGFQLVRLARRGTCPVPSRRRRRRHAAVPG